MGSFEITRVQVEIAGPQAYTLDGHISTRSGKPSEVISVSLGPMVVYIYDLAAARAFAAAWRLAQRFVPVGLPQSALNAGLRSESVEAGLLFQVAGAPETQRINGVAAGASPTGRPFVRVELGRLIVQAHDVESIVSAAAAWQAVEATATRMWPEVDAFVAAEYRERTRVARKGAAGVNRGHRVE